VDASPGASRRRALRPRISHVRGPAAA
jgi:hypothetical protein